MNQKAQVLHRDERKIDWQNLQTLIEIVPHIAGDGDRSGQQGIYIVLTKTAIHHWQ